MKYNNGAFGEISNLIIAILLYNITLFNNIIMFNNSQYLTFTFCFMAKTIFSSHTISYESIIVFRNAIIKVSN